MRTLKLYSFLTDFSVSAINESQAKNEIVAEALFELMHETG